MSRDTSQSDSRLTRRQRTALATMAVVCIVLTSAALVTAQSGSRTLDDFESGNAGNWTNEGSNPNGTITAQTDVVSEGTYSMEVDDSAGGGDTEASYIPLDPGEYQSISTDWYDDTGGGSVADSWIAVNGPSEDLFFLEYHVDTESWTISSSDTSQEEIDLAPLDGWTRVIVTFDYNNSESTAYTVEDGDVTSQDTFEWPNAQGSQSIDSFYLGSDFSEAYFDDVSVNATPPGDLSIDANNYMRPGTSQHVGVTLDGEDVTDNSTIATSNNDTLTYYPNNDTLVATGGRSELPDTVTITATHGDYDTQKNVTIAKPSVENLPHLPTWWKINATVGDGMMLWLIVATLAAVVATRAATSFAGVGAYVMFMVAGWMTGSVSDGVMVAVILTGLFLGMNLAANVDTTIRGTG